MKLEVVRAGIQPTIQDLGRVGSRRHGVSLCGALDSISARMANLLVGNEESDAVLEMAIGGLRLCFRDERLVAWCGAPFSARLGSQTLPAGRPCCVSAGEEIVFTAPAVGMRAWFAVSGGIDVPLVLGSRSTDLRAGLGGFEGRALRDGDALPLGEGGSNSAAIRRALDGATSADWGVRNPACISDPVLRVVRGNEPMPDEFLKDEFVVTADSNRMGLRLQRSRPVPAAPLREMVSEAVTPGTVQLPPSGQPIVLLADCQTIGGYPRIAHVITVDFARAAQLRPGDAVRFREVSLDEAAALLLAQEREIEILRAGLALRLA